jgi:hypothetical protein
MDGRWAAAMFLAGITAAGCTTRMPMTPGHDAGTVDAARSDDASEPDAARVDDAGRDAASVDVDADIDAAALTCDGAMVTLPDPTAVDGTDDTEPADCAGCPRFTSIDVTATGTTAAVRGTVTGAATCAWYLVSPSCGGTTGAFGPDPEFGMFSITLPLFCGTNRLQLVCENASGTTFATRTIVGPSCGGRAVQVTLTWGATSNDQELHLVRSGGHINDATNDCTWFTCVSTSPDWGVAGDSTDDPHKDVDWVSTFGPENIYLTRAADGSYEVMVEYWGSGTADTPTVTITLDGRTAWMGSHAMDVHDVWDVGTITLPGPTFTARDTITPCAADWRAGGSYGCGLAIP